MENENKVEQKIDSVTDIDKLEELEQEINQQEEDKSNVTENNDDLSQNKNNSDDNSSSNDDSDDSDNNNDDSKNNDGDSDDNKNFNNDKEDKKLKTPISDEDRKKYAIPEKFKYFEDVVAWGKEAEKAKNQYDTIRHKTDEENKSLKEELEKLKKDVEQVKSKQDAPTKEEKQAMIDKFNEEFMEDPISAIENVMKRVGVEKKDKQVESEEDKIAKAKEVFNKKAKVEWDDLTKDMTDTEKIEFGKECQKICNEHPEIISLYVVKDMIDGRKARQEKIFAKEQEKKNKEKRAAAATISNNTVVSNETLKKIDKANSLSDLDKLEEDINNDR